MKKLFVLSSLLLCCFIYSANAEWCTICTDDGDNTNNTNSCVQTQSGGMCWGAGYNCDNTEIYQCPGNEQ